MWGLSGGRGFVSHRGRTAPENWTVVKFNGENVTYSVFDFGELCSCRWTRRDCSPIRCYDGANKSDPELFTRREFFIDVSFDVSIDGACWILKETVYDSSCLDKSCFFPSSFHDDLTDFESKENCINVVFSYVVSMIISFSLNLENRLNIVSF